MPASPPTAFPDYAGRTLLVLGGRPIGSCDIVAYAQACGARVIVTDYLELSQSPAKQLADETWELSTAEISPLVERARSRGVDAVFTGAHEFNLRQAEQVCQRLGLPFYAGPGQLELTSDKRRYKRVFASHGLDSIPELCASGPRTYPLLLKPVAGSGAHGIRLCEDEVAFVRNYPQALDEAGDPANILIEPYLPGTELTAFYLVQDGQARLTALADRLTTPVGSGLIRLPCFYRWPSRQLAHYRERVDAGVVAALDAMGLRNGMAFVQFMLSDGRFLPYDMGFRLTGTQEYHLLQHACGFNPLHMLVDHAMTGHLGQTGAQVRIDPVFGGRHAASLTLLARPGRIGRFVGLAQAAMLEHVVRVIPNHPEGTLIPDAASGTLNQVAVRVLLLAGSETALHAAVTAAARCVRVLDTDGRDMLLPAPCMETT